MIKKEYYKHMLPHFQQPGQAYFVTWNLKDAVPKKALKRYSDRLEILKSQIEICELGVADLSGAADSDPLNKNNRGMEADAPIKGNADRNPHHPEIKKEYYSIRQKYIKAYNDLLDAGKNPTIDLSKSEYTNIIINSLKHWGEKRLKNFAYCIMPNHVHWVFELFEKDEEGNTVYLQDILYSVKRFSATQINKLENRTGALWQKESFDTTIRDEKHLYYTIEYTLNNPVVAGFVKDWKDLLGCGSSD